MSSTAVPSSVAHRGVFLHLSANSLEGVVETQYWLAVHRAAGLGGVPGSLHKQLPVFAVLPSLFAHLVGSVHLASFAVSLAATVAPV
jgi:hypothetical protein